MPKVTIWIREEDFETWEKLSNRAEFIHGLLVLAKKKQEEEEKKEPQYTEVEAVA